ncbi:MULTISPECIES: ABC transporter ATP-binding protein [Auritidibacter]|uniref:ABC transporter ATP-binding protein n=1 Tax=Auritidibacter TaxID=1160973 RepID=UPI000D72CE7B|nr:MULTISPECIES: ABC transporter ATP-binding protein [Auritidibacter]PXA78472.1 ABC transporter [Auritidibacter sp. NML120779]AXR74767.1 ATP-binding cassette domain-containing protein [Auritidibacter sp. NML130574]NIH71171.1 thiamine transport system ATP-binding protein [Auritidibacter ignavus]PXA78385.1 ABC transporter [Auritidibacter sp. NML100628]PXA79439.1 ABC transporter [Auritidibacter sp. NML120636]
MTASTTPQQLIAEQISVHYPNGYQAITEASFQVHAGTILVLLGPSGSGKSSLLRGIAGLERISSGTLRFGDRILAGPGQHVPAHRRGIGMVFQSAQLFPHRSVAGNISYGLEVEHLPRSQRRARVERLLQLVNLPGFGRRNVATLSGGQAQRVALARSLAVEPAVMLLDEPLSALDTELRSRLADDIRQILTEAEIAGVYVTHDHAEARMVADQVALIDQGRLQRVGTVTEVLGA